MKLDRRFVADRAVGTHLVVVSAPSLAFCACFVEAEEPIRIQIPRAKFAVEGLNERVVRGLAWSAEVQRDASHVGPVIELLAHELGAIVDSDRLGISELG